MKLSLRHRILMTLLPWLALLACVGAAAVGLLHQLGGGIDDILRENYDSVIYMERLKESLERIDSSFAFALSGQDDKAKEQYRQQWPPYITNLVAEQDNITIPGEGTLVEQLKELSTRYRRQGDEFFTKARGERHKDYFGPGGLLELFGQIKDLADQILRLNQDNMEKASHNARRLAQRSLVGLWIGLAVVAVVGTWLARHTLRAILLPIQAMTESSQAIGAGNLDQVVPVVSDDEFGQLAGAFNTMARQLREYRQSQQSQLSRIQQSEPGHGQRLSPPGAGRQSARSGGHRQSRRLPSPWRFARRHFLGALAAARTAARAACPGVARDRNATTLQPALTTPSPCVPLVRNGLFSHAFFPSATPARRRWGRRCCWRMSPAFACSTR